MKRSLLILCSLMSVVGCAKHAETSTPNSFDTEYRKVLGPESDTDSLAAQLFAVLQRYAYTTEGSRLAPHFKHEVDTNIGVESLSILSREEGIKCDKITSLAGVAYLCEFALKKEGLDHDADEKSIPAILYKALANVRGTSPKAIMDSRNSIACKKDAGHGYACELKLPDAANKSDVAEKPRLPQEEPAADPHGIPVFQ